MKKVYCLLTKSLILAAITLAASLGYAQDPLMVGTIASDQSICSGAAPALLTSSGPLNGTNPVYQWQSSADNLLFNDIEGATNTAYLPPALTATTYYRQMQNADGTTGGPLPTNVVTISVKPYLVVGSISPDQTICSMATPVLLVSTPPSTGSNPTYQWQMSFTGISFMNLSGGTNITFQPSPQTVTQDSLVLYFRQRQNDPGTCGGPLNTNVISMTILPYLTPGTVTGEQAVCPGNSPVDLTATATPNGQNTTYQWQSSPDNNIFQNIPGATGNTYQPGPIAVNTWYRVEQTATSSCGGAVYSNSVLVSINENIIPGTISGDQTICAGDAVADLTGTPPANGTNPVYQWQSSLDNSTFENISGATSLQYQPSGLTTTTYFRLMQNADGTCGGPVPTNVVTITLNPDLLVGTIAANQSVCSGDAVAMLTGTPPLNGTSPVYQWQSSLDNLTFTNISGATALNFQPGAIMATTYFRLMQNAGGTCGGPLPTNTVSITLLPDLLVGSAGSDQTVCAGSPVTVITGTAPLNGTSPVFQWQSSSDNSIFTDIPGATALTYQPAPLTATTYFRQMQNAGSTCGGPLPTNSVTITVNPDLVTGTIGADQIICSGDPVSLLTATPPLNGTAPTYQWQSSLDNNTFINITGATSVQYQPGSLSATTYFRQMQNAGGTCGGPLPTNVVTITVNPDLLPGTIASDQTICVGDPVSLLTGNPPLNGNSPTYQWQSSLDNITFSNITGATALNYQPGNLTTSTYFRQMQNSSGTCGGPLPTNVVTIVVNPSLVTGSIASDQSICAGDPVTMLTGTAPLNGTSPGYQWQSSLNNSTFTNIAGATDLNYQPSGLTVTTYFRQMQNASGTCGGPLPTNTVTISVTPNLLPGSIGSDQTICSGSVAAALKGVAPLNGTDPTYQWQSSLDNSTFTNISGATFLNYQPGSLTVTTYFRQLQDASGTCNGPMPTNVVTITVIPNLQIGSIAADQSICAGDMALPLTGSAPLNGTSPTYQWQSSLDNSTFTNIAGATALNYQPGVLTTNTYFRQMQNASGTCGGPLPTNTVTVTVTPQLLVGSIGSNQTICAGSPVAMLTGTAPRNGNSPNYQWQSSLDNNTFVNISGATALNYQPGAVTTTTYFRQMQNAAGTCNGPLPTNTVTITVTPVIIPGTAGSDQSICSGEIPAMLMATPPVNATAPVYQWQSSLDNNTFTNIFGATAMTYQPAALTSTTYFRQIQTDPALCDIGYTNSVSITVGAGPVFVPGTASGNQSLCAGDIAAMITATPPANGTSPVYQWQSSLDNTTFANISGATALNYQPGAITSTTYYRLMQNATGTCGGPLPTNVITIDLLPNLIAGTAAADQTICLGEIPAVLTATPPANGTGPIYQWQSSLDNSTFTNINGATMLHYQPGALNLTTYYRQLQKATDVCGIVPTNTVTITVGADPLLIPGSAAANQSICSGNVPALLTSTPPANGTSPVYQWQSSLDNMSFTNISGATDMTYPPGAMSATTYYRVMQDAVGTCGGPLPTNVVTIEVNPLLITGSVAADQSICSNELPALLTSTPPVNGTNPAYQWQSSLDNVTFTNINGATTQQYQSGLLTATTYFRQVQNAAGTCGGPLATNTITITVTEALQPGTIAASQTICTGTAPALLTGSAPLNGTSPVYQWQSSLDNTTFTNINGATALNYQPGALSATTYFRQMQDASGVCGGPMSTNVVTITVQPALAVGSIGSDQTICNGSVPAMLTGVAPSNGTSPVYQWQSSLDNTTFTNISGATALNYQPGALTATTYYRQIQNATGVCGGPLPTNIITITVGAFPALIPGTIGNNQSLCTGDIPSILNATPPSNGTMPTYQWQSSLDNATFTNIAGATALNYQPGALTATTYYRQMQNAQSTCGGPLPTNVVTITVNPLLIAGSISANQSICEGQTPAMLIGVPPANGTSPVYQWQSSLNNVTFTNITGATSLNYQPGAITATTYYRQIQNAAGTCGGPLATNVVTISFNPNLIAGSISANQSICAGQTPAPLIGVPPANGTSPVYQWQSSLNNVTFNNISGATVLNYQPGSLAATTYYRLSQNASGTCGGPLFTNTVTITVNPLPVPTITGPASACVNSTGNVYTTQAGMTSYTWSVTGGTITAGATTNAITVTWNTTGAQTVSVNYNTPSGCTATSPAVYNVTVNPLPVPTITGPASACINSAGNVYTTQSGMTGYTWSVTGGTITAGATTNAITVTWNTTGAQTVSVNYNNGNGCTATTPTVYNVTVNPLPVPTITGPASVCVNSAGNVYTTQTGMTGYTWTVTGGTITAGATTNSITVTWNTAGAQTVTVNYVNGNGCTAATPTVYNVTVNPLPVPTITGPASACVNSAGNVYTTQTGMTGYTWTVTGGTITTGSTTNAITVTWNATGAQTVTVNYVNGNGCTAATPTVYNVTVNPLPVPTITGPASVCVNSTGNIYSTQTGMTGYTWIVTGGTITAGATTSAITVTWNTAGAQTVSVNYVNANGCTATTPTVYNVTVNPLPVPTITGPASVCVNSTGNVYTTQTGMTGYTWTVTGGTITAGSGTNTVTVTWGTAGTGTICVNYTNAGGCTAPAPVCNNVTINPAPTPTITGPASVCQGETATYTTQSGMTNYTWVISSGGTITGGGTPTSNTVTVQWNTVGAQTVQVNYTAGCPGSTPTVLNVTVNAAPVPTIGSTNDPCVGDDNIYYTQTGMTGYVWTVSPPNTFTGQGTASINVTWSSPGLQTVTVNYTNANGCPAAQPAVYTVFVSTPPGAAAPITGTATVCAGASGVVYTTSPVSGATSYTWTLPSGAVIASGAGTTSITVNFGAGAVSGVISVAAANQCGNGPVSTFNVTVNPLPAAAGVITGPANVCAPGSGYVYAVPPIANTTGYNWTLPTGATITAGANTNTITVSYATTGSGVITVNGINACGNGAASPDFTVTVNQTPPAPVVTANGALLTSSAPAGNQWYYEGTGAIPSATGQTYTATITGWYWCTVTLNGCTSDTSNHVYVLFTGQPELPGSSFTVYPVPSNGIFNVSIQTPAEQRFTIRVYSQIGALMFEMNDAQTISGRFDTKINLGTVADGLYSVVILNEQQQVVRKMIVNKLIGK